MLQDVILTTALCLSEADSDALLSGRSISALSNGFINSSRCFAICSAGEIPTINAWAELDSCLMYRQLEALESLSWNTIWTQQFLQSILEERKQVFVNILRVHQLQDQIEFTDLKVIDKIGGFIRLPKSNSVVSNKPVLNNRTFSERKHRLKNQSTPKYPELEEFQTMLTQCSQIQSEPEKLDVDIRTFLGWQEASPSIPERQDWFSKISAYGYRSDETENSRKSNYQAGTDFELVIRESLGFLGFTVDRTHVGGAGGIDVFCSAPYSFVGECKCGISIPDKTVEQLDRIAKRHLEERYKTANRFIIGPGSPTPNLLKSADLNHYRNLLSFTTITLSIY
jgi:hypothetical protein